MKIVGSRITPSGQISLPASLRSEIGMGNDADVVIDLAGRAIRIRLASEVSDDEQPRPRRAPPTKRDKTIPKIIRPRGRPRKNPIA